MTHLRRTLKTVTISRYAERHPLITAYMVHRFVMHKYHPDLVAAKKARKAQNSGAGFGLMLVVFVGIPAVTIFLLYILVCVAWYGLRYGIHKVLRRSTPNPNLVVPGYFPKQVKPGGPSTAEGRATRERQEQIDGLARHEAARQARIATVMASLDNSTSGSKDEPAGS